MKLTLLYLLGNRKAIESFISNKNTLKLAFFLLLTASFAREYDQLYFQEAGFFFFLNSLLPSLLLSFFLFVFIYRSHLKKANKSELPEVSRIGFFSQYSIFLGLFWMTAPVAWIYAIPVEQYFSPVEATSLNLYFLGMVSIWRVLLCTRIVSVWLNIRFGSAFFCILFPASIATFVGSFFVGMTMLDAMGGTALSPERELMQGALFTIMSGAFFTVIVSFFGFIVVANQQVGNESHAPKQADQKIPLPYFFMLFIVLACIVIAIPAQKKFKKSWTALRLCAEAFDTIYEREPSEEKLMQQSRKIIQHLSQFEPSDFPKGYSIPPDPYSYEGRNLLPFIILAMEGSEKQWVQQLYMQYFSIVLHHLYSITFDELFNPQRLPEVFRKIAQFSGGKEFLIKEFEENSILPENFSLEQILSQKKDDINAT